MVSYIHDLTRGLQAIFFGANDACLPNSPTNQHVPLPEFKHNLRDIILHSSIKAHKPRIILITTPPVCEYKLAEHNLVQGMKDPNRTAEHTKKYADACRAVGYKLDVTVLDIWAIMMAKTGWKEGDTLIGSKKVERSKVLDELLVDGEHHDKAYDSIEADHGNTGLHFKPTAYRILYDSMMELVCQKWPEQNPNSTKFVFPTWVELLENVDN